MGDAVVKPASLLVRRRASRERGVVLFVAVIVLVIMTLAGLALLRQMGIGTSIAGNIAFKENATSVADRGVEEARLWMRTANLSADSPTDGYHSSWVWPLPSGTSTDPTTFDWSDAQSREILADQSQTGNRMRIFIQRLCATAGAPSNAPNQVCSDSPVINGGASHGGGGYPSILPGAAPTPYFRITTRVEGPRNTVSYVQVLTQ